jgi:hypothetical protein
MRAAPLLLLIFTLGGCGYIGDPLPPALNLARRIVDLRAVQYGDRLAIDFTIPALTTDNLPLRSFEKVDLRAGTADNPFDAARWAAEATALKVDADKPGAVHVEAPASQWIGKDVIIAVRVINKKGHASDWSQYTIVRVVPPVPKPVVKAEPDAEGVKLTWSSTAPKFRVYRRAPGDEAPAFLANADQNSYVDKTAEYGKEYEYVVQAIENGAESEVSTPVTILNKDIFPPAPPAGLNAVPGIGSIELVWERNTESDLRGYRIYRASEGGDFSVLAEFIDTPRYSDRQIDAGKKYRYAVTALDQAGNESGRSAVVEVTAP